MLPDDYGFSRMQRKWEAEEDRRIDAWIDAHQAPDMDEEDDDENND